MVFCQSLRGAAAEPPGDLRVRIVENPTVTETHPLRAYVPLLLAVLILGSTGCASMTPASEKIFKLGLEQAESGNVMQALKTLRKGVVAHSGHVRMRFELARLQYETGESHHLRERQAMRKAARFLERGKREEALSRRRAANESRAKATPYYQAAKENLTIVVDDEAEERRVAWGYYLLMRVDVFFEDYEAAYEDIEQAILLGRPTGPLLAQWREYQAGLRERLGPQPR